MQDPNTANECNSDGNYLPDVFKATPEDQKILDDLSLVLENSPVKLKVTKLVDKLQVSTLCYVKKKSKWDTETVC